MTKAKNARRGNNRRKRGPQADPETPGSTADRLLGAAVISLSGAACGAGYLAVVSLAGGGIAGCGPESGCNKVLASRWAYWLGLPVSVPAILVYCGLLVATWFLRRANSSLEQRRYLRMAWSLAPLILGAALWFFLLQVGVIHAWCKFCLATHGLGSLGALLVLAGSRRFNWPHVDSSASSWSGFRASLIYAGIGLAILVTGQVGVNKKLYGTGRLAADSQSRSGLVSLHQGKFILNAAELPLMGSASATNFMVSLFDYTCSHCRALHPLLTALEGSYGGRLGVISLPMPLDAGCNPLIRATPPANQNACEYAKLSLAVWRARPAAFRGFDDWLFEARFVPPLEEARAKAETLVGKQQLEHALQDPWIGAQLHTDIELYRTNATAIHDGHLPQLVIGDQITSGVINRLQDLQQIVEQHLGLIVTNTGTLGGSGR